VQLIYGTIPKKYFKQNPPLLVGAMSQ